LLLPQTTIERFVDNNDIDLLAFIVYVRKSDDDKIKIIKNIINGKIDIYTKNKFIKALKKR
jgi:hypothetical protein